MVNRTLNFVLEHDKFKTLGSSRTDAMVSANKSYFELFLREAIDPEQLLRDMNVNLPRDIRLLSIREVDDQFNIIQDVGEKEYLYHFSFGEKSHPFCAPFMIHFLDILDVELMKKGAALFEGTHNFKSFCYKPGESTSFSRTVITSRISEQGDTRALPFSPSDSFVYLVKGSGFMRHQVRLMMGALVLLGKGEITLPEIEKILDGKEATFEQYLAPASGLLLNDVKFKNIS